MARGPAGARRATGTADTTITTSNAGAHTGTAVTPEAADPALAAHTAVTGGGEQPETAAPSPAGPADSTRKTATTRRARRHRRSTRSTGPTLAAGPTVPSTPKQQ